MLINQLLHTNPVTIDVKTTIKEAVKLLITDHINALIVMDNQKVVGILSLQDIASATIPTQFRQNPFIASAMYREGFFQEQCASIQDLTVAKIMRKKFVFVTKDDNIMAVIADFLKNDLYLVPVIENEKLVGVITRSEIKHALAFGMKMPSKYWQLMKGQ